ncbi:undecaprenyl-diphosphate phosphatase [Ancylobacter mangrovi]|uniref:Undecaprenyl-diphosphatase n=1 Tax=Ancylobacter mangrovi TaxID=2972472 RepID=A0A9X2PFX7_9HYPH|nr:undecaprenyl-diphosphate phosphatase [Ancylobacter mangrovi]MCS0495285.1 undecaprenyl-diphosphate phosphatase [Ancylobacter mangrovi]MCS0502678.1 undecaprenyl-diphosphate phosphatase [Ancylobacter mangrovi]
MSFGTLFEAFLLGLLEGFTEFLPVSSTGHILLAGHFLGFESQGKVFEVLIQLGAILAIVTVYFQRFWHVLITLPTSARSRRFVFGIIVAFLPAAVIGALAHDFIKRVLFETPALICVTLILGGIVLIWVDTLKIRPIHTDAMAFPPMLALKIGFIQCLAMIPGTSRSGSTIVGGLLLGASKQAAAEFSFFLALPTMTGAFAYDLYKNRDALSMDDGIIIMVGFIAAFVAAVAVVRSLLAFVSKHGYTPFGWWRIAVGGVGLVALALVG